MNKEKEELREEAYGMVSFSRISSNGSRLHGTELPQNHIIELRVKRGHVQRDLTDDRFGADYFPKDHIVSVRMTNNQFSELITSLNVGEGVPCTIKSINGIKTKPLGKHEDRKSFIHRKFKERLNVLSLDLKRDCSNVNNIVKKQKLSKADKRDIEMIVHRITQELNSNIPFFLSCFQESTDKLVTEAKSEIESAILHKVTQAGMQKLFEQNLIEKPDQLELEKNTTNEFEKE